MIGEAAGEYARLSTAYGSNACDIAQRLGLRSAAHSGTISELTKHEVQLMVDYERLIPPYLAYLRTEGFIDETVASLAVL